MKPRGFTAFLRNAALVAILVFAAQASFPAFGGDYRLPDTGQTRCYDNDKETACPEPGQYLYGQDGNYKGPQPSFKGSVDGTTVSDFNTGLMWQQADVQYGSTHTWQSAVDYCQSLTLAGYSDWRLPSVSELESILDLGRYSPAIDTGYFSGCRSSYYWSDTAYAYDPGGAWYVDFASGHITWDKKSHRHFARCVRVEQ